MQKSPLQRAGVGALYGLGIGALSGNAGRGALIGALAGPLLAETGIGRRVPGLYGGKKSRRYRKKGKTPKRSRSRKMRGGKVQAGGSCWQMPPKSPRRLY